MKIALIGYGRMGQEIDKIANSDPSLTIVSKLDAGDEINQLSLNNADVAIDFTHPTTALSNLEKVAATGTNLVMGTTGWYDEMTRVREIVEDSGIGFLWASNFSIGVHMFWKVLEEASKQFAKFPEYDVFGHEFHHNMKADSPSGTAKSTAEIVLKNSPGKKEISYETQHEKVSPETLHFSSTRGGKIPGTHSVYFDSAADTVEITHTARSREGFASGALRCAQWLNGKTGFFTIEDYLTSLQ